MYFPAVEWVLKQRVGSGRLKGILMIIAGHYRGGSVPYEKIAQEVGYSRKTIRRHLKRLEELGFIAIDRDCVTLKMGDAS